MTSISLKTEFLKEISITEDFTDINDLIGSVTMLLFAAEYTLHDIKAGYEAELEIVKERIQREIKEEQKATENNEFVLFLLSKPYKVLVKVESYFSYVHTLSRAVLYLSYRYYNIYKYYRFFWRTRKVFILR